MAPYFGYGMSIDTLEPWKPPVPRRILVTGSREWKDEHVIREALVEQYEVKAHPLPVLIHGGAVGADSWADWFWRRICLDRKVASNIEAYPAEDFVDDYTKRVLPKKRNLHMVSLGADICLAFALAWASGTGHCARAARRVGIEVKDYGVSTE